ncbi:MAG: dicarboxylate/amino acid:cation symporter [Tannerellaceae bacterium]|nr:dicarboxylate/amino acid:cation symporter [Tannerellaceae bacterium]
MTTVVAVFWGLGMGLTVKPGNLMDQSQVAHIQESYKAVVETQKEVAANTQQKGPLAFLEDIIPNNIVSATADNSKMLQVIFFAVFFGIAALTLPDEKIKPVLKLFDSLNEIILKMVDYIIKAAPIGVLALMAGLVVDFWGGICGFSRLWQYMPLQ